MRRVLLLLLFLMLIPWADVMAQPFAPTGSVRTCTDCDTTACTAQQMIAIEPVPGTGQGLPYICDTSTGFFIPWPGGAGGGAPTSASYLTLGLNGTLTAERVRTTGDGLFTTDAGANGTFTVRLQFASGTAAPVGTDCGAAAGDRGGAVATGTTYLGGGGAGWADLGNLVNPPRPNLPAAIAYEDEANTYTGGLVQ